MKRKFIIHLLGLLLLSGCGVGCQHVRKLGPILDDLLRQMRVADDALKAAQKARTAGRSAKAIEEAERAIQATQHAKEAHRQALQSAPDAQQSDEITRALQQLEQTEYEAQFIKLEAQADIAIAASTNKIKSSREGLASASESELHTFLRDLLCFHLETILNKKRLPSDEDYEEFVLDYAITRFVPVWEIKGKAESIIKLAVSTSKSPSAAELQARKKFLEECTLRRRKRKIG